MRLEQLKYLVDVAQTHSITNTAQHFFITQQAISSSLKQLEEEFCATLLNRHSFGVTLTEQGKVVVDFAQRVIADFDKTFQAVSLTEEKQPVTKHIKVVSSSLLNSIVMPKVLTGLPQYEKNWTVNIIEMEPEYIVSEVAKGNCDIGLLTLNKEYLDELLQQYAEQQLQCDVLLYDQLIACMGVESSSARLDKIYADKDSSRKMIFGVTPIDKYKLSAMEESIICSSDITFHKKMLLQNDVYTYMPKLAYTTLFKGKKFTAKPLILDEEVEIIHCVIYKESSMDDTLQAFIDLMKSCMR